MTKVEDLFDLMCSTTHNGLSLNDLVGGGDPKHISSITLQVLLSLDAIHPDSIVFDLGCGCGRTAIDQALMLQNGQYLGFDIVPALVNFCKEKIAPRLTNTQFYLSAAKHELYQPYIDLGSDTVEFDDASVSPDLITAFSLFTHFDFDNSIDYLNRMRSKLRPDGAICLSMFLLNESSKRRILSSQSDLVFDVTQGGIIFGDQAHALASVAW